MDAVEAYLKRQTDLDWEAISPLYLYYKTTYNIYGQFCVFAPGDWIRKYPYTRFYIPANKKDLHDLRVFLKYLNNAKKAFIKGMPWIKITFGEDFPALSFVRLYFFKKQPIIIKYSLKFSGDIALRPIGSLNNTKLGFYVFEAKMSLADCLIHQGQSANFELNSFKLSFSAPILGDHFENELKFTPPNKLSANMAPVRMVTKNAIPGWEMNGMLGYSLVAEYYSFSDSQAAKATKEAEHIIATMKTNFCRNMHTIAIFVKELGEGVANESPPQSQLAPPVPTYQNIITEIIP